MKTRILILGGTGFIGRNLVEYFAANPDYEVHAVCWSSPKYTITGVTWHIADLRSVAHLKDLIPDGFFDIVIQTAATTSGSKDICNNPSIHVTDNVVMNSYIFRVAHEAKVKHVIFFSCSTMFSNGHVTETSPIDIHPRYFGVAHMKLFCEKMCEFYAGLGDTCFSVIRHSNIFGAYDKYDAERSHFFGATIAKVEAETDQITIWGNGQEARDLLYVDDLCNFVELAIHKQENKFELFNCGSGIAFKVHDVAEKIIEASGKKLSIIYDETKPTIPVSLSLDCSKAKNKLGWEPKISLDDGIRLTLDWYKKYKV